MLTATGIGSGLDIESLVTQLVAAERAPTDSRLTRQESRLTAELSAFGAFKGALAGFQNSLADLTNLAKFGQYTATSSNSEQVGVSAGSKATAGSYELAVSQLARAHSLASGSFAATTDAVGTGTLTFRFGTTDYTPADPGPQSYNGFTVNAGRGVATIAIDAGNNTLAGVRDAINEADIGVKAAIVNDGSGYRLLLSSAQTGAANSLEITVDDTGDGNHVDAAGLSALAFNSGAANMGQTVAAQDALFSINGLGISSAENQARNAIDGVTITLKELTGTAPVTLTIAENRDSVKTAISNLIAGYNSFNQTMNSLTAYNAETRSASPLQGDFSARSIASQLRQTLSNAVAGFNGPFSSLSEIGITTESNGNLKLDSVRLDKILVENFDQIAGLFAQVGFPGDSSISYVSASDKTAVGSYLVNVSQLASKGQLLGAVAAFPLDIDADNDNFSIKVNGVDSASISLTQGNYANGDALAAEIQSRINGDSALAAAGIAVSVVFNGDHLEITSSQYGSASTVEITSVDTATTAELGLATGVGTTGLDVAGTIGGATATGRGQLLTGGVGSGSEGLQLLIEGALTGSRGHVEFSRGIAFQLNELISGYLEPDGVLASRTDGIQGRVEDISDKREVLDRRIEALEIRYRAKFNALDTLLSQLSTTSDFLTQQLAALPKAGSLLGNK
ncbi:MAG: flagellar filament capping protein FliD [Halioglobus sp.]|nr:flagellar filament capping protein FliD [Halioglobus sp.]MCB1710811.1 flagellar filament capping protein FliD [Halioglobus sp.]MCP5120978.1 flagellar filament capping protein FliD [Pseudomonadales bacterium]MCP5194420.1 flagellar filament capping protein FliD [Pseudomonadales bacterium]